MSLQASKCFLARRWLATFMLMLTLVAPIAPLLGLPSADLRAVTQPMKRKGSAGKRARDPNRIRLADEECDASSIATFCRRHGFSVAKYYQLKAEGRGPVESLIDGRIIITRENQEAWRRALPTSMEVNSAS